MSDDDRRGRQRAPPRLPSAGTDDWDEGDNDEPPAPAPPKARPTRPERAAPRADRPSRTRGPYESIKPLRRRRARSPDGDDEVFCLGLTLGQLVSRVTWISAAFGCVVGLAIVAGQAARSHAVSPIVPVPAGYYPMQQQQQLPLDPPIDPQLEWRDDGGGATPTVAMTGQAVAAPMLPRASWAQQLPLQRRAPPPPAAGGGAPSRRSPSRSPPPLPSPTPAVALPPAASPPPLPPPPLTLPERVDSLNRRFAAGRPSGSIAKSGVLVRQFERETSNERPWLPCGAAWCATIADRLACTIINDDLRNLFYDAGTVGAGLVLAPSARLYCAYPEDGNSVAKTCEPLGGDGASCIPGCYPAGETCPEVAHDWQCSFPPEALRDALQAQMGRRSYKERNNEIIVDAGAFKAALPHAVEGFFFLRGASGADQQWARKAHADFLDEFDLEAEEGPPLMELDLRDGGSDRPFKQARAAG